MPTGRLQPIFISQMPYLTLQNSAYGCPGSRHAQIYMAIAALTGNQKVYGDNGLIDLGD